MPLKMRNFVRQEGLNRRENATQEYEAAKKNERDNCLLQKQNEQNNQTADKGNSDLRTRWINITKSYIFDNYP